MIVKSQPLSERAALFLRLGVGLIIGLVIAFLIGDDNKKFAESIMPEDWREILAQTLALVAFIIWAGAAVMRRVSLAIWSGVAAAGLLFILWHVRIYSGDGNSSELQYILILLALTFIGNELVSSADQAGKPFATYELYFDEAWKRGVQLVLAIGFTLLFWGILQLGAALLGFIGFKWLTDLLRNEYFALPITGLAFASAVHLGDIQPKLLANVRGLALGVLAWLLPVITLIGAIFAVSLAFSGLQPLWDTKAATATLLGACIGFVLLINAAFQQGEQDRKVHVVLKWCVWLAALLLLVFAVLAAWSLGLRINQYGLTIDRTVAGMVVVIALAYGIGYSVAIFWRGPWMEKLKPLNIGLAVFKCVVFIAILTPVASPARLSVDNQVARLTSGKIKPERFDWFVLSADTGTYGKSALDKLVASSDPSIASWAKRASEGKLERRRYYDEPGFEAEEAKPADLSRLKVVSPKGAKLPASFLAKDFTTLPDYVVPRCLMLEPMREIERCTVALLNVDQDQANEVVVLSRDEGISVFKQTSAGWVGLTQSIRLYDEDSQEAFKRGDIKTAEPVVRDLMLGRNRLHLTPVKPVSAAAAAEDTSPPSKR
ncbi:DUF4153 domain-containing protein [Aquidulcibacter sp.]|jgi:hypothetical protein|uniref:DUF4153 domain-containing protein n=1 Tax=Aquidulcibacter sp. TaxID=2052990 RepID=UPI0037C16107